MLAKTPFILPCLPRLRSRPPAGKDWLHEVAFEGCRVQLHKVDAEATTYSRRGVELTSGRALIAPALARVPARAVVLDGVLVAGNEGQADADEGTVEGDAMLVHCFDLLALNGKLRHLALLGPFYRSATPVGRVYARQLCRHRFEERRFALSFGPRRLDQGEVPIRYSPEAGSGHVSPSVMR
jgi:hypothetical protein